VQRLFETKHFHIVFRLDFFLNQFNNKLIFTIPFKINML
jgi:hypothetical protein